MCTASRPMQGWRVLSLSPLPWLVEATGLVTRGWRRGLKVCRPCQGLPSSFSRNGAESRFALAVTVCVAYSSGIHLKVTVQTSLSPGRGKRLIAHGVSRGNQVKAKPVPEGRKKPPSYSQMYLSSYSTSCFLRYSKNSS